MGGPARARARARPGADVLNVWAPEDWEHNVFYYTSHIGMRSTWLRIKDVEGRAKFMDLMAGADIFFSNRRAGYLEHHDLTAEALCKANPGLIHTQIVYANPYG